jgi:hypothetical protein
MHLEEMQMTSRTAFENKGKAKGRSNVHGRHTERLVTEEIEMLHVVLYQVLSRRKKIIHACRVSLLSFHLAYTEALRRLLS